MRELQQKQRAKRRLYSMPVLALMLVLVVFFARSTYLVFQKRGDSVGYVSSLEAKVRVLEEKQKRLMANIALLETDEGIEKEVKEKYNVAKEGEYVVILVDQPKQIQSDMVVNLPWYKKLWNAIINIFI